MRILDKNIATQERGIFRKPGGSNEWRAIDPHKRALQKLTDEQILELSELIVKIERHYGFPCDIEWAYENGKFYITQSRPITTLSDSERLKTSGREAPTFFDGHEWTLAVTRSMSFWHQCLSNVGHYRHMRDYGIDAQPRFLTVTKQGVFTSVFFHQPNYGEYARAVMEVVKNRKGMHLLERKYKHYANEVSVALKQCLKEFDEERWADFLEAYSSFCASLHPTTVIGRTGGEKLVELLRVKGMTDRETAETIALVTYPRENTPLFLSQLELLEIGSAVQKNGLSGKKLERALDNWLERHGHIPVNFCDDPWRMEDARSQLERCLERDCASEISSLKKNHEEKIKRAGEALEKLNDSAIAILAYVIAEATSLNEFRKNVISKVSLDYRPLFVEIAERCGSSDWHDVFFLTPEETMRIVRGERLDMQRIIRERQVCGSYIDDAGGHVLLDIDTARKLQKYVDLTHGQGKDAEPSMRTKEIEGSSANKGRVTGVVKIVLSSGNFDKLKRGDVLVTTMTSVDFVPVMERAAAFVTNEGGITSHASIVAREMDKPCIIGTKIATQVLHDGDPVEVDADNGVVRVLERAGEEGEYGVSDSFRRYLQKHTWHKFGHWKCCVLQDSIGAEAVQSEYIKRILPGPVRDYVVKDDDYYFTDFEWDRMIDHFRRGMQTEEQYLEQFADTLDSISNDKESAFGSDIGRVP